MVFKKIKRVWSHNDMNYLPKFRETFPELNKVSSEEMRNRFISLGIDFYTEEDIVVKGWIRLTLPFALILFVLMFVSLPLVFIFTDKWGYSFGYKSGIHNWFRILGLL